MEAAADYEDDVEDYEVKDRLAQPVVIWRSGHKEMGREFGKGKRTRQQ